MSTKFQFVVIPADFPDDGGIFDLNVKDSLGDPLMEYLPGIKELPLVGSPNEVLGLTVSGHAEMVERTDGVFREFIGGWSNQRYSRIGRKTALLARLEHYLPDLDQAPPAFQGTLRLFLEVFIANAKLAIAAHGVNAGLIIY